MKYSSIFVLSAFISLLTTATPVGGRAGSKRVTHLYPMKKDVTKLYPVDSLNYLGRYGKSLPPAGMESKEEVKVVLLGKDHTARNAIKLFLEQRENFAHISALFIVEDESVKRVIEMLISQDEMAEQMGAVMVVKYEKAEEIINGFLEEPESASDIRALLIVKNQNMKFAIEEMLYKHHISHEVKVVLIGKEGKAKEIIIDLLGKDELAPDLAGGDIEEELTQSIRIVVPETGDDIESNTGDDITLVQSLPSSIPGTDSKLDFGVSHQNVQSRPPLGKDRLQLEQPNNTRIMELAEKVLGQDLSAASINQGLVFEPPKKQQECQLDTALARANILEMRIYTLVARLKSFLLGSKFDHFAFELQGSKFDRQLSRLERGVTRLVSCKPELRDQMAFARKMYDEMMDSIEFLKYYEGTNTLGHREISAVIDINVRLLRFRDSYGMPDVTMDGYGEAIRSDVQQLNFWRSEFHELDALSFGKRKTFEKFFSMAEVTLINLGVNTVRAELSYF